MTSEQRRLKRLIGFIGRDKSLRQLASEIGVVHSTLNAWKNNKRIGATGREKLSTYLGVTSDRLKQYLNGTCTLEELMQGGDRNESNPTEGLTIDKVVRWFATLSIPDLMVLLQEIASIVMGLASPQPEVTIASLTNEWDLKELAEECHIPIERLKAIASGKRPDDDELAALAVALLKEDGEVWTANELIELRDRHI